MCTKLCQITFLALLESLLAIVNIELRVPTRHFNQIIAPGGFIAFLDYEATNWYKAEKAQGLESARLRKR